MTAAGSCPRHRHTVRTGRPPAAGPPGPTDAGSTSTWSEGHPPDCHPGRRTQRPVAEDHPWRGGTRHHHCLRQTYIRRHCLRNRNTHRHCPRHRGLQRRCLDNACCRNNIPIRNSQMIENVTFRDRTCFCNSLRK